MVPVADTMPANVQDMDSKDEDIPQMYQEYVRDIYNAEMIISLCSNGLIVSKLRLSET